MDETGEVEGLFAASETWTDSRLAWAKDRAIVAQFHALCDSLLGMQGEVLEGQNQEYFQADLVRSLVGFAIAGNLQTGVLQQVLPTQEVDEGDEIIQSMSVLGLSKKRAPKSPAESPLEDA